MRVVRAWGWSMHPNIKDGYLVILKEREPSRGEVICFSGYSGTKTLHRLVKLKRDYLTTKGDNCLNLDKAIKWDEILGVAIALKRENRIIPLKGRWLYGYFYFFSGIILSGRNFLKWIIMSLQELDVYSRIIRVVFPANDIEIVKGGETDDFYFIKSRVKGREAATLKIEKKDFSVVRMYVKIMYRKLGIEERLKEEGLRFINTCLNPY